MQHSLRAIGIALFGLVFATGIASAQSEPAMHVERTPTYVVTLDIGPADTMDGSMMQTMDQGMEANHVLAVGVTRADSSGMMADLVPTVRLTDKASGVTRDLPQLADMHDMSMTTGDAHFGQNVFVPDGTYTVSVMLGTSETAQFRDVVIGSGAMMDHGMNHDMGDGN